MNIRINYHLIFSHGIQTWNTGVSKDPGGEWPVNYSRDSEIGVTTQSCRNLLLDYTRGSERKVPVSEDLVISQHIH
jgi:hypothetical protein